MKAFSRAAARVLLLAAAASAVPVAAQSPCGPSGLTISWSGAPRLGDAFALQIAGTPSASGLVAADLAPGPVQTSVGLICLGMTPAMQLAPFALDAAGAASIAGVLPPSPALSGLGVFLQAGALDALQPGGLALSNGLNPVIRPPRIWIFSLFSAPAFCVYDVLTDTASPAIPLPGNFSQPAAVPALGWVVLVAASPTGPRLMAFDGAGATMVDVPIGDTPGAIAVDGTTVYMLFTTAWTARAYSLPSGAPGPVIPLSFSAAPSALLPLPGTGIAFARSGIDVVPIDFANGVALPPINLGTTPSAAFNLAGWLLKNGILYCMLSGGGIFGGSTPFQFNSIDTATFAPLLPSPVPLPLAGGPSSMLWATDAFGAALFVVCQGALFRVSLSSFQSFPVATVPNANGMISAGGSELLLYDNGFLHRVDLSSFAVSSLGVSSGGAPIAAQLGGMQNVICSPGSCTPGGVLTVPSSTLRKAYLVTTTNAANPQNQMVWYATDPLTPAQGIVPLPLSSATVMTIVD